MYYSEVNSIIGWYYVLYTIIGLVFGIIWGFATKSIYNNKGYDGGFWVGFFLGVIGLIIALTKPDISSYSQQKDDFFQRVQAVNEEKKKQETKPIGLYDTLAAPGSNAAWKCSKCGKTNPNYIGTCGCGMNRSAQEKMITGRQEETKAAAGAETERKINGDTATNTIDEREAIQIIREYKGLLDCGAISQEEFDKRKSELLKL